MLDFGFSEILLTSAIALVVLGPERLPKVARQVGNWMGRARAMARQLSEQLEREVSAEELLKDQVKPRTPLAQTPPASLQPPQYDPHRYVAPATASPFASPDPHTPLPDPYTAVPDPHVLSPSVADRPVAGQSSQAEPHAEYDPSPVQPTSPQFAGAATAAAHTGMAAPAADPYAGAARADDLRADTVVAERVAEPHAAAAAHGTEPRTPAHE